MNVCLLQPKHAAIIFLSLALAGCLGGTSAPTNFYMLSPLSPSQTGMSAVTAEDRIRIVMERDDVPRETAIAILKHDDSERQRWSRSLYGVNTQDSSLYDIVLRIHKFQVEDAADMICHAARLEHFQATPESQQTLDDRVLAAEVKAELVDIQADLGVSASGGAVRVAAKTSAGRLDAARRELEEAARKVPGVKSVEVHLEVPIGSLWTV